jgi:hypothetical protein
VNPTSVFINALLLVSLAAFAQDDEPRNLKKPEVDIATKGPKRAWESAPAEKKALWLQHREALTHIDLSDDTQRRTIIARGTTEPDAYHAHPTTAMLADNKTIFCVWNIGNGGHAGPMARSDDAGLTWTLRGVSRGIGITASRCPVAAWSSSSATPHRNRRTKPASSPGSVRTTTSSKANPPSIA